jgi:hypothetical protein
VVVKANEFQKNHVLDLKKKIIELEKQLNNQLMNQFKNLSSISEADETTSNNRNSWPRNPLAVPTVLLNDDPSPLVHAQDDDGTTNLGDDGPTSTNSNRSPDTLVRSDDSIGSNNSNNNSSQRNSLEEFSTNIRAIPNENNGDSYEIQMQDMSPKRMRENSSNNDTYNTATRLDIQKSPLLHSFGSVGNSFARKVNLNQFLIRDDYQAPDPSPNS